MAVSMHAVTGKISPGPLRGKPLIERSFYQLVNVMGFEPYKGTLDVKVRTPVDVSRFATKTVDRVLLDGSRHIDLYVAPVTIVIRKKEEFVEIEEEPSKGRTLPEKINDLRKHQEKIIREEMRLEDVMEEKGAAERHDCFAVQERDAINKSVIELMDKISIKEKYGLKDGDTIDIIFYEREMPGWKERFRH